MTGRAHSLCVRVCVGVRVGLCVGVYTSALMVIATTSQAQTVTLQQGQSAYTGASDTYLNNGARTTNYGSATSVQDQSGARGVLVRFKIFAAEGGPVPNGATIGSATLSLYKSAGGATTYGARRLLKNWVETQATWNIAATGTNWATPGATGAADILATADATAATTSVSGWLAFNVTSGVAAIGAGAANYGWRLVPTAGATNTKSFHSREYTSNTTLRPKLAITYTPANVPPTVNLTAPTGGAVSLPPATIARTTHLTRIEQWHDVRMRQLAATRISRRNRSTLTAAAISGCNTFTTMRRPSDSSKARKTRDIAAPAELALDRVLTCEGSRNVVSGHARGTVECSDSIMRRGPRQRHIVAPVTSAPSGSAAVLSVSWQ